MKGFKYPTRCIARWIRKLTQDVGSTASLCVMKHMELSTMALDLNHSRKEKIMTEDVLVEPHKRNLVESKDGTLISYDVIGEGPGLIIVPGVMTVAENYASLAEALSPYFTVYTIDRRGRGFSGLQGDNYTLQKEVEDISALQSYTLAPYLFGHSYGGLIALETVVTKLFDKIAVFEPGVSVEGSIELNWLNLYEDYLSQSDHLSALALMMRSIGSKATNMVPLWAMKLFLKITLHKKKLNQLYTLLPANLNEQKQLKAKDNSYYNYSDIVPPVLLMRGKATTLPWARKAINVLRGVIPNAKSVTFGNLNHFAPVKEPKLVAKELEKFFLQQ